MELVAEKQIPEPAGLSQLIASAATTAQTPPKPTAQQGEYMARSVWKQAVLATINVLVAVIAVRLVLLVAVVGALVLARAALEAAPIAQQPALVMLGVYCLTVVVPLVWLASRR
jgi:hypothetical protein